MIINSGVHKIIIKIICNTKTHLNLDSILPKSQVSFNRLCQLVLVSLPRILTVRKRKWLSACTECSHI